MPRISKEEPCTILDRGIQQCSQDIQDFQESMGGVHDRGTSNFRKLWLRGSCWIFRVFRIFLVLRIFRIPNATHGHRRILQILDRGNMQDFQDFQEFLGGMYDFEFNYPEYV